MKNRKTKILVVVFIVLLVWLYTYQFGSLDTFPRRQMVAESSDNTWRFEVYQRRLKWLNPFADSEITFRITDVEGHRVSEQRIWRVVWQNGFHGTEIRSVRFEKDVVIVNDFWVADKENLQFEMCPLLECLLDSD